MASIKVMSRAFTLLELLVVIIIVGVLSTLGITHYGGIREQAMDKEAIANVMLIMSAERIYRMEDDIHAWYFSDNIGELNNNLRLSLPAGNNRNWDYHAKISPNGADVCIEAQRNGGNGRFWSMTFGDPLPPPGPRGC
jgi:prepilin-type N-terminal cleavage/methylation domain-containing protein